MSGSLLPGGSRAPKRRVQCSWRRFEMVVGIEGCRRVKGLEIWVYGFGMVGLQSCRRISLPRVQAGVRDNPHIYIYTYVFIYSVIEVAVFPPSLGRRHQTSKFRVVVFVLSALVCLLHSSTLGTKSDE